MPLMDEKPFRVVGLHMVPSGARYFADRPRRSWWKWTAMLLIVAVLLVEFLAFITL